jgi:hypothetical protein
MDCGVVTACAEEQKTEEIQKKIEAIVKNL